MDKIKIFRLILLLLFTCLLCLEWVSGQSLEAQIEIEEGEWIDRRTPIRIQFNREYKVEDGRLSVWIESVDVTGISTIYNDHIVYQSNLSSLPSGSVSLKVYLVGENENWRELAAFSLNVRTIGGLEELNTTAGLTLTNKGQLVEEKLPVDPVSDRPVFQDVTGQFNLKMSAVRNNWAIDAESQIMGVSFEREALRFRDLGADAPKVDLARYQLSVQNRGATLSAGHLRHGRHQHLLNGFQSRGLMYNQEINQNLEFTVAGTHGSNVVGWSNFIGLNDPGHRIFSGALGIEAVENSPGTLRFDIVSVVGAREGRRSFNQESIAESETSRGLGVKIQSAFWDKRVRGEASVAASRFNNPNDPFLSQGEILVQVVPESRMAWFGDLNAQLIRNMKFMPGAPLNVRSGYSFSRVDPLYEAVGINVRGDLQEHKMSVVMSTGPLNVNLQNRYSEDNLDNLRSILKTLSHQTNLQVQLNTSRLLKSGGSKIARLMPNIGYSYNFVHQYGDKVPEEGGFDETHVPDQRNHVHQASTAWQSRKWSVSYRFQTAYQDNRQPGREDNDFLRTGHVASLRLAPVSFIDFTTNFNLDLNQNKAVGETEVSRRIGYNIQIKPVISLNIRMSYQPSRTFDRADTRLRTHTQSSFDANWRFTFFRQLQNPLSGTLYLRYSKQVTFVNDQFREIPDDTMIWTIQSGITLNLF